MDILLRNVTIIDKNSANHLATKDILVVNGIIQKIDSNISNANLPLLEAKGSFVSAGWIDVFAHFADPGMEYRETLETGAAAAFAGGYTTVFALANTQPVIDNKAQVAYVVERSKSLPVNIKPLGAITQQAKGQALAEMYDMYNAGAVAFSDGLNPVQSPGLFLKALQYVKAFDGILLQQPFDNSIGAHGLINEGIISTQLGLPGLPAVAEEIMVMRDIELLRYTESRLHITGVASAKALDAIVQAKKEGLRITCSVTPYHLLFTDDDMQGYDTNLKCNPPIRSKADRDALRTGVLDGTVDIIASHHLPQHYDDKVKEFEYAKNGMIGLQTAYAAVQEALPTLSPERIVELFSANASRIFQVEKASVAVGALADLTVFNPEKITIFTKEKNKSKAQNSPFFDLPLKGEVLATIAKNTLFLNK